MPIAFHCWQGDDVTSFDHDGLLTGVIQTTGDHELMVWQETVKTLPFGDI